MATSTTTGLRIPARLIKPLTPALPLPPELLGLVALNRPVRLILGNRARMLVRVTSKPISKSTSASSNISTSSSLTSMSSYRPITSSRRPGVATTISEPCLTKAFRSSDTGRLAPPTSRSGSGREQCLHRSVATTCVCLASSRVGEMMRPPICRFLRRDVRRRIISMVGMRKASVLPDPVTAWTHTSLLVRKSGMAADWTGVMDWKL
mmetsp:Transcript_26681/g.76982  ORF Transcript_26681/g.76982 Transcript_26681/m.76982 type:complete len:207 (-) Transcript_26681:284-904(-)